MCLQWHIAPYSHFDARLRGDRGTSNPVIDRQKAAQPPGHECKESVFNKLVKYDIPKGIQHRSRGTPIKAPTRNLGLNLVVKKALNATYRQFHNLGDVYIRSKHVMRENTPRIDALLLDF